MAPPDRSHADRGKPFDTLWEAEAGSDPAGTVRGGELPQPLARYGGRLAIALRADRPTVVANFVESLDGVVAFEGDRGSGAEVSGYNEPDRFVMGLLRALADVVIVGAGTVRASGGHEWTPRRVNAAYGNSYEAWRAALGLRPQPTTVVVSARGDLSPAHRAFANVDVPVLVVTTDLGKRRLGGSLPEHVRIAAVSDGGHVAPEAVLGAVEAEGAALALCEGGPHLMADFVGANLIDELFLTLAPQLLGRSNDERRPGFINGLAFPIEGGAWTTLRSVHRAVDHLFLRYAITGRVSPR